MQHPAFTFLAFAVALLAITSCLKPPDYPDEPVIEFLAMNQTTIAQGRTAENLDTLVIVFGFTDGDGDLGDDEGAFDIRLRDSRDDALNPFRLPVIPEQGVGNGISGEITLRIPNAPSNLCCIFENGLDPCTASVEFPTDTFSYSITLTDRAGNVSNAIRTDPITLLCQ